MTDRDGTHLEMPDVGDVHGWTVLYQTISCRTHTHRVLGWVGDMPSAIKVAAVTDALWHPVIRSTATPAPDSRVRPQNIGVITSAPPELLERLHRGEKLTIEDMRAAGAEAAHLHDEVLPEPVMIAVRVIEHLDAIGVDVIDLLEKSGEHNGRDALLKAGGEAMVRAIIKEFPSPDMSPGTGH